MIGALVVQVRSGRVPPLAIREFTEGYFVRGGPRRWGRGTEVG